MSYSSKELCSRARITKRQMDNWYRMGWLAPFERDEKAGSGTPLEWPTQTFEKAKLMSRLIRVGFKVQEASEIADRLMNDATARADSMHDIDLGDNIHLRLFV
jgi:hypothetical protein